jgi:hypothetical protein
MAAGAPQSRKISELFQENSLKSFVLSLFHALLELDNFLNFSQPLKNI